jgi:hypothetical protein
MSAKDNEDLGNGCKVPPWVTQHTSVEVAGNFFLRDPLFGKWYLGMGTNTCQLPDQAGFFYLV